MQTTLLNSTKIESNNHINDHTISKIGDLGNISLPLLKGKQNESVFIKKNGFRTISMDTMKVSAYGSLRGTLDSLDIFTGYDESVSHQTLQNSDLFKVSLASLRKHNKQMSFDDFNKFNATILKTNDWGSNSNLGKLNTPNLEIKARHEKLTIKKIEAELGYIYKLGKKIMNLKLPRSRIASKSLVSK